ncbi:PREDICTED: uncharacterized protein LOC108382884 [Rhagoletis zephyria]|uniref:uncharacterized protein LOC108382884 n=1 Tax=Rhagoletis zephyria TaxID=28612 RepID=UPI00081174DD|nr:PREDICTED: uncharacterized protein LOC108382884 [Rhagoletis zephyria]
MFYGAQVWGGESHEQVEKLLRFFIKKLIFLPANTPNYMLHLETGIVPQYFHTLRAHMLFITRCLSLPTSRLPRVLADESIRQEVPWVRNWKRLSLSADLEPLTEFSPTFLKVFTPLLLSKLVEKEFKLYVERA